MLFQSVAAKKKKKKKKKKKGRVEARQKSNSSNNDGEIHQVIHLAKPKNKTEHRTTTSEGSSTTDYTVG